MKRYIFLIFVLVLTVISAGWLFLDAGRANGNAAPISTEEHPSHSSMLLPYTDTFTIYLPLVEKNSTRFSFRDELFNPPSTLALWVQGITPSTGEVTVNGSDTQQPTTAFTWDWGDGLIEDGWFAKSHIYANTSRNYIVKVTSHYNGGATDQAEILIRFVAPIITPVTLPEDLSVTIPDHTVSLGTRLYAVPSGLSYFDNSYFDLVSRANVEYILSVAASIQNDFSNGNVYLINNGFNQVVLRDASFGGMYSLWFTNPPSFISGNYGFQETIQYSSFFHEMGHNFSLNSPANYYYGGRIDGNANAIFSESMANIFAHATAYQILNNPAAYGLDNDLALEIEQSAAGSIMVIRNAYENYLATGKVFHSWNDPNTPQDETFDTFMTIAFKFCAHAEDAGQGYRTSLKRMMALLQHFNEDWKNSYAQNNDTPEAEAFRATLMVAALSHAFGADLRTEFEDLNFPINDAIYDDLMSSVNP